MMQDWDYCRQMLPKVSRTFALNITVLKGDLHRSILTAYLFCRIVDTVEDATRLDPKIKIRLLQEFARLMEDAEYRAGNLSRWVDDCRAVDGTPNDLDLLHNTPRVFNVFDALPANHRDQIIPSVCKMAKGMAMFQQKFSFHELTLLEDENELEEYCYFVAGLVGEMLCNLFFQAIPGLSPKDRRTMERNAVSFGLGLQMTNISKDIIVDRGRGWSYIPRTYIAEQRLTVEEFNAGTALNQSMEILERLLNKTTGHLEDALRFTLAIPRSETRIRLFCIWPLWMAMETVAVLHNNQALLNSDDPVKISRATVRRILRRTRWLCYSDLMLKWSFGEIKKRARLENPPRFDLDALHARLEAMPLDSRDSKTALSL